MTLINVNCFVVLIKRQTVKKITREMPKAKFYQCSKQYKSENSIWSFANMLTSILSNIYNAAYWASLDKIIFYKESCLSVLI